MLLKLNLKSRLAVIVPELQRGWKASQEHLDLRLLSGRSYEVEVARSCTSPLNLNQGSRADRSLDDSDSEAILSQVAVGVSLSLSRFKASRH